VKIVLVNNGLAGGGIERASVSLANHWAEEGHKVDLIAIYQSDHFFSTHAKVNFIEPSFSYGGIKVHYSLRMMWYLRRRILRLKPDAILAFGENSNPYVLLATRGIDIPVYVSDRMHPKARLPKHTFWLKKRLYPKAAGIVAQTNLARQIMLGYLKRSNIAVIPNPVNVINKKDLSKKPSIVAVGRLEKVKGFEYLIRAFAKIDAPGWRLNIVGDGSLMKSLKNLCADLGIDQDVTFDGHLNDFAEQVSEASIYVLPSIKEGFPNALLEAMSVPLPCIVTDFMGANNEIIQDGDNGLIVPVRDADAMAEALNRLIEHPELRERLAANAISVREDYAFDNIAKRYLEFIKGHAE